MSSTATDPSESLATPINRINRPEVMHIRLIAPLLTFAIALSAALYHNFLEQSARSTFFGDSGHYLETCRQLTLQVQQLLTALSSGTLSNVHLTKAFADSLLYDGPILPTLPTIFFVITRKIPTALNWQPFVILGCILNAFSASFVCLIVQKLSNSWKSAFIAGLVWATYPAAIIAAGRYLTEVPVVFCLLALSWSAARLVENDSARLSLFKSIELGIWTGLLFLLRPALIPAILAINVLSFALIRGWNNRLRTGSLAIAGFCVVIIPLALGSKAMTGTLHLSLDRAPTYNAAVGCNTQTDGWETFPMPSSTDYLANSPSVLTTIAKAWQWNPATLLDLTLRKVVRLWIVPWNDFRVNVFGISAQLQSWWHTLLFALAVPGGLIVLASTVSKHHQFSAQTHSILGDQISSDLRAVPRETAEDRAARLIGLASILLILGHLTYVPFGAICRYGFTAMPFIIILAAYSMSLVFKQPFFLWRWALLLIAICLFSTVLCQTNNTAYFTDIFGDFRTGLTAKLACQSLLTVMGVLTAFGMVQHYKHPLFAKIVVVIVASSALAVALAFYLDGSEATEWSCVLQPGESACRQLLLPTPIPEDGSKVTHAFVLIDGDASCKHALLSVNGQRLPDAPELLLRLRPSHYFVFDIMRTFAAKLGKTMEEMRQWRIVSVPLSCLHDKALGFNEIRLTAPKETAVTIYGDYSDRQRPHRRLPMFDYFSPSKLCNALSGTEGRLLDPVGWQPVSSSCWLEQRGKRSAGDLSTNIGKQTGQYRLFLILDCKRDSSSVLSSNTLIRTTTEKLSKTLSSQDFDPLMTNTSMPGCLLSINRAILKAASHSSCLIEIPKHYLLAPYLAIKIDGYLRAHGSDCQASVLPIMVGAGKLPSIMVLPATPPYFKAEANWKHFEISDCIPSAQLPGGLKSLKIALFPGRWEEVWQYGCDRHCGDTCFRDMTVEIQPVLRPQIGDQLSAIY